MPIVASASLDWTIPPSPEALAQSIAEIVAAPPGPAGDVISMPRGRADAVARLGLALAPWPGIATWAAAERLDGLFLHRHWTLEAPALPPRLAVVASHEGFDRRFGFGDSPELSAGLGVQRTARLSQRDGYPLGTVGEGAPRTVESLRTTLQSMFGGIEAELAAVVDRPVTRIAAARAMTPELLREAAGLGADVYVTGQLRERARAAAAGSGLHLFAVGHRRSEAWGLARLGEELRRRWPDLPVVLQPDAPHAP